jgi:uncharacterized membrane protein YfcA
VDQTIILIVLVCALYFVSAPVEPSVQRANIIIANTSIVIFMVSGLLAAGIYNAPLLTRTAIITPLFLAGTQLGKRLFAMAPSKWFKRIALVILLATGLSALIL